MMPLHRLPAVCVAVVLAAGVADAQSLGDVARREAERRGEAAPAGKVYTNGTLKPDPTAPATATAPADAAKAGDKDPKVPDPEAPAAAAGTPSTAPAADSGAASEKVAVEEPFWRVESYWRKQADAIRAKQTRRNADVLGLRQRLTTLPPEDNEFRVTEGALKSALASLEAANEEWRRLEELVRIRKVPDAWIR
jgi:hypothetical protein